MKKRLWFGLAVVPFVLLGIMLWARKTAWERLEADFRRDVLASTGNGLDVLVIENTGNEFVNAKFRRLGVLKGGEVEAILKSIHLQKSVSGHSNGADYFQLSGRCGGVVVTSDAMQNHIESQFELNGLIVKNGTSTWNSCAFDLGEKWSRYELTPESARVLRDSIFAKYPRQIKAFQTRKQ